MKLGEPLLRVESDLWLTTGNDYAADPNARTPKPDRPKADPMAASILKRQQHPEGPTLFMGNLPFDATEEAIRDMIEEHSTEPAPAAKPAAGEDEAEEKPEVEEDGQGEGEEKQAEPENTRGGKKSGLRKVRLGAFEDTGRCKG
jgi:RNA recognition motif-containing protein